MQAPRGGEAVMFARLRESTGRWLCLRGFHRFVHRREWSDTMREFNGWHKVCARTFCGQQWELVRASALIGPKPLLSDLRPES
jgi:hypothetical protein